MRTAGRLLAEQLRPYCREPSLILAIPSGGVPVGLGAASALNLPFDLMIIRKIQIPGNTEAGFGAVSLEGDIVLNEDLIGRFALTEDEIEHRP